MCPPRPRNCAVELVTKGKPFRDRSFSFCHDIGLRNLVRRQPSPNTPILEARNVFCKPTLLVEVKGERKALLRQLAGRSSYSILIGDRHRPQSEGLAAGCPASAAIISRIRLCVSSAS